MKIIMAAGGTGGHIYPALAVAKQLGAEHQVIFVGSQRGQEVQLVPAHGYELHTINVRALNLKGVSARLNSLWQLPQAFYQAYQCLRRHKPDVVLGIGGSVSGPVLLLASLMGIPTAILEPNATAGFSNRILKRFVQRIFVAFKQTQAEFPSKKVMHTGNPLRANIANLEATTFKHPPCLLIFGGSQGARKINQAVVEMLSKDCHFFQSWQILHQTGQHDHSWVKSQYQNLGLEHASVQAYFDDMASQYQQSSIVIARSGSSVFEIAASGRPSILVPYPHAADQHQYKNAQVFVQAGASLLIDDGRCDGHHLRQSLNQLLDPHVWQRMQQASLTLARPQAAASIAEQLLALAKNKA